MTTRFATTHVGSLPRPEALLDLVFAREGGETVTEADFDRINAVNYKGTLLSGFEFDSSYKRNEPASFGLNQVISGWTEGLQLMNEGSKYRFFIPYNLAYGSRDAGQIPPYSTLIFEIELIKVTN